MSLRSDGARRTPTAYMPFVYLPPRSFATLEDDTAGGGTKQMSTPYTVGVGAHDDPKQTV